MAAISKETTYIQAQVVAEWDSHRLLSGKKFS